MGRRGPFEEISAKEARGDSKPVSPDQFQRIAGAGERTYERLGHTLHGLRGGTEGLDRNWSALKHQAFGETQKSWGGMTINSRRGEPLPSPTHLNRYAVTAKPPGEASISLPENVSEDQFGAAMDRARQQYAGQLGMRKAALGVFHDDEEHRIDIDPSLVVRRRATADRLGAYTHAVGGAYNFRDAKGYWPPHVQRG